MHTQKITERHINTETETEVERHTETETDADRQTISPPILSLSLSFIKEKGNRGTVIMMMLMITLQP